MLAAARSWHRVAFEVPAEVGDEVAALCFELGSCGIHAEEKGEGTRLLVYFEDPPDMRSLQGQLSTGLPAGLPRPFSMAVETEPERDWIEDWRRFYRPQWATDRIVVHPPWLPVDTGPGQISIAIDPAMAFGTGGHESTQLALRALQETGCEGRVCLDLGAGSGVLSIAAIRLGARRVVAVDVDPVAVDNARHNLRANLGEDSGRASVRGGSVEAASPEAFHVVVANLESHLVRPLLPAIASSLTVDGVALFSGLVATEGPLFEDWLARAGLRVDRSWSKGAWIGLRARSAGDRCRRSS